MRDSQIVGEQLARVLPQYNKPWFKVPHLLQLNLILLVPLLSSAVSGYDGELGLQGAHKRTKHLTDGLSPRLSHQWHTVYSFFQDFL